MAYSTALHGYEINVQRGCLFVEAGLEVLANRLHRVVLQFRLALPRTFRAQRLRSREQAVSISDRTASLRGLRLAVGDEEIQRSEGNGDQGSIGARYWNRIQHGNGCVLC